MVGKDTSHTLHLCQESIEVEAPIWRVYEAWSHPERFPEFIKDIAQVEKTGAHRYRWQGRHPSGQFTQWETHMKEQLPNQKILWESVSESYSQSSEIQMEGLSPLHTRLTYIMIFDTPITNPVHDWFDNVFHRDPHHRLHQILETFKEVIEYETATPKNVIPGFLPEGESQS